MSELKPDESGTAIVPVLACVLQQLCLRNDRLPPNARGISKFHALKPPAISIKDYLMRVAKYAACSGECFVLALVYIDRIIQSNNQFVVNSLNIHRLLITAIMLAAKFFDDQYFNNAYYAKVGGVPCNEVNSLEVEFLFLCNFALFVNTETYSQYYTELCSHALNPSNTCGCAFGPRVPPLIIPNYPHLSLPPVHLEGNVLYPIRLEGSKHDDHDEEQYYDEYLPNNQSNNQSNNRSINQQPINQSMNQPINQQMNMYHPVNQSVNPQHYQIAQQQQQQQQYVQHSMSQQIPHPHHPLHPHVIHPANHPINQPINQSNLHHHPHVTHPQYYHPYDVHNQAMHQPINPAISQTMHHGYAPQANVQPAYPRHRNVNPSNIQSVQPVQSNNQSNNQVHNQVNNQVNTKSNNQSNNQSKDQTDDQLMNSPQVGVM